jgi:hypothetical protein
VNSFTDAAQAQLLWGERQLEGTMEVSQYYRAMEAFSRQHAKMDGESEIFWLAEAEVLAKLGADAHKLKAILQPKMKDEKQSPGLGA